MQKGRTLDLIAIFASVGLHALLLLIPWQPAEVIELMPLEGTGVVEVAVMQQVRGNPDAALESEASEEAEPEITAPEEPETKTPAQKKPQTAEIAKSKPIVSIKPVEAEPVVKARVEVAVSEESEMVVPVQEAEEMAPAQEDSEGQAQTEAPKDAEPAQPPASKQYPGDDPTGEAMVASKRQIAYPKDSMNASTEGDVLVEVSVSQTGSITSVTVISGPEDETLKRNAQLSILRYWTFKEAERAYAVIIEVSFRMQPEAATSQRFISARFSD